MSDWTTINDNHSKIIVVIPLFLFHPCVFKNHNLPSLRVVFLALPSIVLLPVVLSSSISQMDRLYLCKLELETTVHTAETVKTLVFKLHRTLVWNKSQKTAGVKRELVHCDPMTWDFWHKLFQCWYRDTQVHESEGLLFSNQGYSPIRETQNGLRWKGF